MRRLDAYYDARWRKQSQQFLRQYPFCILCLCYNEINRGAADYPDARQSNLVVDHIIPHRGKNELFWDQDNWQTLCRFPCHDLHKQRCESRQQDWWQLLRAAIKEHNAWTTLELHAEWIPSAVIAQVLGGICTSSAGGDAA